MRLKTKFVMELKFQFNFSKISNFNWKITVQKKSKKCQTKLLRTVRPWVCCGAVVQGSLCRKCFYPWAINMQTTARFFFFHSLIGNKPTKKVFSIKDIPLECRQIVDTESFWLQLMSSTGLSWIQNIITCFKSFDPPSPSSIQIVFTFEPHFVRLIRLF